MGQLFSKRIRWEDISLDDIVIVVIGPSGAGKSTFINTATEIPLLKVNNGLAPCTTKVEHVLCTIQSEGCSKKVVFVDTPAYPDPGESDEFIAGLNVEMKIREWSRQTFGKNITVTGILYLHRINENRMTQAPLPHFQMFEKLCGEGFHTRVLLVTTMWDTLMNKSDGERRKAFLRTHWSDMIDRGSAVVCHDGTKKSAWEIVKLLTDGNSMMADLEARMQKVEKDKREADELEIQRLANNEVKKRREEDEQNQADRKEEEVRRREEDGGKTAEHVCSKEELKRREEASKKEAEAKGRESEETKRGEQDAKKMEEAATWKEEATRKAEQLSRTEEQTRQREAQLKEDIAKTKQMQFTAQKIVEDALKKQGQLRKMEEEVRKKDMAMREREDILRQREESLRREADNFRRIKETEKKVDVKQKQTMGRKGDATKENNNTLISGSAFNFVEGDININNSSRSIADRGITKLFSNVATGAFHDSGERFDPPKRHPNTRAPVIQEILDWLDDPESPELVMWLHGTTGTGKSTIAQTIAQLLCEQGRLSGSFFFARGSTGAPGRDDERRLVPTLAYQLAKYLPDTRAPIAMAVLSDPAIFDLALLSQVQNLLINPLWFASNGVSSSSNASPRLFIIDGLDDCRGADLQCRIFQVFAAAMKSMQYHLPQKLLMTSRSEIHLLAAFNEYNNAVMSRQDLITAKQLLSISSRQ